jgi:hypothetical protein
MLLTIKGISDTFSNMEMLMDSVREEDFHFYHFKYILYPLCITKQDNNERIK